jgi:hypothetical protein
MPIVAGGAAAGSLASDGTDFTITDAVAGGVASSLDTCAVIANTNTWACHVADAGQALAVGDTVALAAGKVTSTATTAVKNVATSAVVAADTTLPKLLTASFTTPTAATAQGDQASLRVIGANSADTGASGAGAVNGTTKGDVKISVLAGSALAGIAGNAVKLDVTAASGAGTCSYDAATKTISVAAAVTVLAPVLTDACNSAPTMKDLFIATTLVHSSADYVLTNLAATTADGGEPLSGGKDTFKVTLTFSEPLALAAASNFAVTTNQAADNTNTEAVNAAAGAEELQELSGVIVLDVTGVNKPSAGLDKVTVSGNVDDRNANRLSLVLTGDPHIVFMAAGG